MEIITNTEREYNNSLPSKILEVGAVFGHKAIRKGNVLDMDYVAVSDDTKVLCINGFDYFIAHDKFLAIEAKHVTQTIKGMESLEGWIQAKFDSVGQSFKVKRHQKDELVLECDKQIEKIILVRQGRLRLRKNLTITKQNVWPSKNQDGWDVQ